MNTSEYAQAFADRLRYYLKIKNMTQVELAEAVGVSQATVSFWCNGTKIPRPNKILDIANVFGIELNDLVEDRGPARIDQAKQELFEKRKTLFDLSAKATARDLDVTISLIKALTENDQHD